MIEMRLEFRFSASHALEQLPDGHKCRRLHGHNYRVLISLAGAVKLLEYWIQDYDDVAKLWDDYVGQRFDHRHLNDVLETDMPTAERLAQEIADILQPQFQLRMLELLSVEVFETEAFSARWTLLEWEQRRWALEMAAQIADRGGAKEVAREIRWMRGAKKPRPGPPPPPKKRGK